MSEIAKLTPECIWRNFDALTQVPRPSGHVEKVQQFLLDFAKKVGVEAFQDPAGNIVMRKPATPGMENRKTVTFQAHMDMVPQKTPDSKHNFETDPIETVIKDGWVYANNTTLGSDNGMGVAAIMAIMEAKDLKHGPVEGLITRDEETGMFGANELPEGELNGDILMNLDSETWGKFVIGSAGGIDITATLGYKGVENDQEAAVKVTLKGLKGGHSGLEIHEGRANANKEMVRFVRKAIAELDARLAQWQGGNMRNAIPRTADVVLTLPRENVEDLKELAAYCLETFRAEYRGVEEEMAILVEECDVPEMQVPVEIQDNLISAIMACHNGVLRFIPSIPSVVETSSNLAVINIGGGKAEMLILARSSCDSQLECLQEMMECTFGMIGMKVEFSGHYGSWQPDFDSPIVAKMVDVYRECFNEEARVEVCHAGLECSLIGAVYPEMDLVSFGPTLRSPHTPDERCDIKSVEKFWVFMQALLKSI